MCRDVAGAEVLDQHVRLLLVPLLDLLRLLAVGLRRGDGDRLPVGEGAEEPRDVLVLGAIFK